MTCPTIRNALHHGRQKRKAESQDISGNAMKRDVAFGYGLASTENVSPRGMRVQADRPWEPEACLFVEISHDEWSATARVVYRETLSNATFAVELELLVIGAHWSWKTPKTFSRDNARSYARAAGGIFGRALRFTRSARPYGTMLRGVSAAAPRGPAPGC